jgi:hypothetical protein
MYVPAATATIMMSIARIALSLPKAERDGMNCRIKSKSSHQYLIVTI